MNSQRTSDATEPSTPAPSARAGLINQGGNLLSADGLTLIETLSNRVFSPKAQADLLRFPQLAYLPQSGKKSLDELVYDYGRAPVVTALQGAILDLARFMGGTAEPATLMEVAGQCAGIIVSNYSGLKPSEVSLFIAKVKRGDFGREYAFSGSAVMSAFRQFKQWRDREKYELLKQEAAQKSKEELRNPYVVTDPDILEGISGRLARVKARWKAEGRDK